MADKQKKLTKDYVLSDSSVNCYGFRLMTSGYMLSEFQKNPIGYHMHDRPSGVVLRWDNLRIEGDQVLGTPVINLSNPRGQQTCDEAEDGFLNAASMGHFVVLEYSNDQKDMLEGQTGPTVTKWYNRECSLVDIPGNGNALTKLYDVDGNELKLADLMAGATNTQFKSLNMNKIELSLTELTAINDMGIKLAANDAASLVAAIKALKLKADMTDVENTTLKADKAGLEVKLDTLKAEHTQKEIADMLSAAKLAGKITDPIEKQLAEVYAGKPLLLKADLDARAVYKPVLESLNLGNGGSGGGAGDFAELQKLSWDDMHKTGKLPGLKAKYPDLYKEKYKAKYGVYPSQA